jgi:hypothetical protein
MRDTLFRSTGTKSDDRKLTVLFDAAMFLQKEAEYETLKTRLNFIYDHHTNVRTIAVTKNSMTQGVFATLETKLNIKDGSLMVINFNVPDVFMNKNEIDDMYLVYKCSQLDKLSDVHWMDADGNIVTNGERHNDFKLTSGNCVVLSNDKKRGKKLGFISSPQYKLFMKELTSINRTKEETWAKYGLLSNDTSYKFRNYIMDPEKHTTFVPGGTFDVNKMHVLPETEYDKLDDHIRTNQLKFSSVQRTLAYEPDPPLYRRKPPKGSYITQYISELLYEAGMRDEYGNVVTPKNINCFCTGIEQHLNPSIDDVKLVIQNIQYGIGTQGCNNQNIIRVMDHVRMITEEMILKTSRVLLRICDEKWVLLSEIQVTRPKLKDLKTYRDCNDNFLITEHEDWYVVTEYDNEPNNEVAGIVFRGPPSLLRTSSIDHS